MHSNGHKPYIALLVGLSVVLLFILSSTCLLWNWIMPSIFGLPRLSLFEMAILFAIINLFRFNWLSVYSRLLNNQIKSMEKNFEKLKQKEKDGIIST